VHLGSARKMDAEAEVLEEGGGIGAKRVRDTLPGEDLHSGFNVVPLEFKITIRLYNELTHGPRYIVLVAGSC